MIENRYILVTLIIIILAMIGFEIFIGNIDINNSIRQSLSNISLGILTSSIVSAIMTFVTYRYKYNELKENLIKNLLEIYSKLVIFKCCYKEYKNKNGKIVELQNKINEYIATIHDIEYDLVYKLKLIKIEETIVLYKYNDKAVKEISKGFECKNGNIINNANGLNSQKDFIKSYNKMLEKVRQYLDKYCVKKYEFNYKLLKEIDNKYKNITSDSIRKIKSSINSL